MLVTGEMGVLRYIGPTQFADGVWLGIELKKPGWQTNVAYIVYLSFTLFVNCSSWKE